MASAVYRIQIIQTDRTNWVQELREALASEVQRLGMHKSVKLEIGPAKLANEPGVAVYFGSPSAVADPSCSASVQAALSDLRVVFPVVDSLAAYSSQVPAVLGSINGWEWVGADAAVRLARLLLEELGIEERQRSVFISYKREDGLFAAVQLYQHLARHRFDPFIDRFDIRAAEEVQAIIADALEARAFLLLLETPLAHTSDAVYDEVEYALSHAMGLHIIAWPHDPQEVPGSGRLRRQRLDPADLTSVKGYDVLTEAALDRALGEIEAAHADALVRRRRNLLRDVEDAAESQGLSCTPLPDWHLLVEGHGHRDLVAVTCRLPEVADLWRLDDARHERASDPPSAVLVHAARGLRDERRRLLQWAAADRPLTLVPGNAIGGYW